MNDFKVRIDCGYCPERRVIVHGDAARAVTDWIRDHAKAHRDDRGELLDAKILSMSRAIDNED